MTGSNLPPGCSVRDIPGNRPEEQAMEAAEQDCIESLGRICRRPEDYDYVAQVARAVLPIVQRIRDDAFNEGFVSAKEEAELYLENHL